MSDLLIEPKLAVLEQMKTLPEAPMAEEEDFALWGIQFCKVLVSRTIAIVFLSPKDFVGGLSCVRESVRGRGRGRGHRGRTCRGPARVRSFRMCRLASVGV